MGKIVRFDGSARKSSGTGRPPAKAGMTGSRTENDEQLAMQADALMREFNDVHNEMYGIVNATLSMIPKIPERENIAFMLIDPYDTRDLPPEHPLYGTGATGMDDDGNVYFIYAEPAGEDGEGYGMPFELLVRKVCSDGGIFELNTENRWEPAEPGSDEAWAKDVLVGGGAEAKLLSLLFLSEDEVTEEEWEDFRAEHSLLTRLYDSAAGLLAFDMTEDGTVILVADDDCHTGFAFMQEKNSLFLCQWTGALMAGGFAEEDDDGEGGDMFVLTEDDEIPEDCLYIVDRVTGGEAEDFCSRYVDRYSRGGLCTFPLSKEKAIRVPDDVVSCPEMIDDAAARLGELTEKEKAALRILRSVTS